jgi:hypothetical protein
MNPMSFDIENGKAPIHIVMQGEGASEDSAILRVKVG